LRAVEALGGCLADEAALKVLLEHCCGVEDDEDWGKWG
jgi:hypothetical protein